jgi:ParB-like chromosome segregation protein Spo0J
MTLATIPIDRIRVSRRLRGLHEDQIGRLQASIAVIGLLNPITVRSRQVLEGGNLVPGYGVVAGVHRLEACKRLGWEEIPANVIDLSNLQSMLAEIDENLAGSVLTKAERALFMKRRKEIWEQLHPETRPTKEGGEGRHKETRRQIGDESVADRFTADTADKTGVTERTIQRDAERGEKILEEVLEAIPGTSLDSGVELDALIKLTPEKQQELAEKIKAGQDVSARPGVTPGKRRTTIAPEVLEAIAKTDFDKGKNLDLIARLPLEAQREIASLVKAGDLITAKAKLSHTAQVTVLPGNCTKDVHRQLQRLTAAWEAASLEAKARFLQRLRRRQRAA